MLINLDSFGHYTDVTLKYSADSTAVITGGVGRSGFPGVVTNGSTFFADELDFYGGSLRLSGVVHGIACQPTLGDCTLFQYQEDDGTPQITIALDSSGHLAAYRGTRSGTLLATSTLTIEAGTYPFIESKVFIDDTDGTVEVHVWTDFETELTFLDFTGDTKNGGTGLISTISYGINGDSPQANWCDKYTCDLVGASFNDLLGNKSITVSFPSGAGDATTWIPTPDVPNWENVSHDPASTSFFNSGENVTTECVSSGADLFTFPATTLADVDAVAITQQVRAFPVVEMVEEGVPASFGIDPPETTTSEDTLTGDLVLVQFHLVSDDPVTTTPTQTGFTLLEHLRVESVDGVGQTFGVHSLIFWQLAAGDGAVTYDFTEARSAFTISPVFPDGNGSITNGVFRNQHADWEFSTVTAQQDGFYCPMADCPVNQLSVSATATPDTFGHFNYVMGACLFSLGAPGDQFTCDVSAGCDYVAFDNGSIISGTNIYAFGLRSLKDVASPDLTLTFPTSSFNNYGSSAIRVDIKPRTTPVGVEDNITGPRAVLGSDVFQGYGQVPNDEVAMYQAPMETAPDGSAWSVANLDALQSGYGSNQGVNVDPPPTMALTVSSSNPISGAAITVVPDDNNGDGDGSTPFGREYNIDTAVTLNAAATAGGNPFSKWQKDGVDYAVTQLTSLFMDDDHMMKAVYTGTCPTGDLILDMDGALKSPQADGSEITTWTEDGIEGYTFVPVGGGVTGPLYDTTPADNIRYGTWDAVTPINRGLVCTGPVSTEIGLPNAFTIIAVLRVPAITLGFSPSGDVFVCNESGVGWAINLNYFGGNFNVEMEVFGQTGGGLGGGMNSGLIFSQSSEQKFLLVFECDGTEVRMMVNGQQLAGKEWFNNNDSSNIYTPSGTTSAAVLNAGRRLNSYYGYMPYLSITNVNLSDAARQAIEAGLVATYGISGYVAGSCDVACV